MRILASSSKLAVLLSASLACSGCGERTETTIENTYVVDDAGGEQGRASSGAKSQVTADWQARETQDPISGERVLTATRDFSDGSFNVRLDVICRGESRLSYVFTLPPDGAGSAFVWQYSGDRVYASMSYRADGQTGGVDSEPRRYGNQMTIEPWQAESFTIGQAKALIVRLHLTDGDPVFTVDQSGNVVGEVIDTCLQARQQPQALTAPSTSREDQASEPNAPAQDTDTPSNEGGV